MSRLAAILLTLAGSIALVCPASSAQDSTRTKEVYAALEQIQNMMTGKAFEEFKQYIHPEGRVISGKSATSLWDALKGDNRQTILLEDSTRQGIAINARSNKDEDAIFVELKTVNAQKQDPRYHSLVLYREDDGIWKIYLWHVGL
jgi:hypothetical protein